MSNAVQENWSKVQQRLRAEVGEDIYSSWFARMDLETVQDGTVRLSVPTRFLKSWIQSHYAERVLACWQASRDRRASHRAAGALGGAAHDARSSRSRDETVDGRCAIGNGQRCGPPADQYRRSQRARGARRLAARSAADLRQLRGRPLQHAGACRGQAGGARPSAATR